MAKMTGGRPSAGKLGRQYVPQSGDVIWLSFSPQAGREQAGRRPALVLSPANYNQLSSLCLACPITSKKKGYVFEVALPPGRDIEGVVLVDHLRSLDWQARQAEFIEKVNDEVLVEVQEMLRALLQMPE